MALGIYVGSLSRYYAAEDRWPALVARVDAWRTMLSDSIGRTLGQPLVWNERAEAPCFRSQLDWADFGALVLWAAYAEHPALPCPDGLPENWDDDPALARSNGPGFRSRYSHLVRNVEIWLPGAFTFTFEGDDIEGRRVVFGSAPGLREQLQRLNAATWQATPAVLAAWRLETPDRSAGLEGSARHAFAVLSGLAEKAVACGLPMKLEY